MKTFRSCVCVACESTTSVVASASAATDVMQNRTKTNLLLTTLLLRINRRIAYVPARGYPNDRRMLSLRLRPARHRERSALSGVRAARGAQPARERRASRHASAVAAAHHGVGMGAPPLPLASRG